MKKTCLKKNICKIIMKSLENSLCEKKEKRVSIERVNCARTAQVFLLEGEAMLKIYKDGVTFLGTYIGPCTVNLAFACELYLKALGSMERERVIRTHDIKKLYNDLKGRTQKEIAAEYNLREARLNHKQCLEIHKNAFENWRYYFEKNSESKQVEVWSLYNLAISLNHVYCNRDETHNTNRV